MKRESKQLRSTPRALFHHHKQLYKLINNSSLFSYCVDERKMLSAFCNICRADRAAQFIRFVIGRNQNRGHLLNFIRSFSRQKFFAANLAATRRLHGRLFPATAGSFLLAPAVIHCFQQDGDSSGYYSESKHLKLLFK